jgi:predicted phage terminase large subunit-like protein
LSDARLRNYLRYLLTPSSARSDPNVFVPFCFTDSTGRSIRQASVHFDLQRFLSTHPKALIELPRDHGKSFQVCCRIVWELGRDPSLRVKVVCATGAIATERVRFIRDAIANNPRVRAVFPKLVPGEQWAANAFTVERPAECIGPSVSGYGLGAGSTGTRADLLVCDDVVDVRSLFGAAERVRAVEYFENNLLNLLEPEGRCWGLFTPWHPEDMNMRLKKNPNFRIFRRAIGANLEPVWPEKWPEDKLKARREEIGAVSFTRGYRLLPVAEEETPIRPEWIRFWTEPVEYERIVLSVDPAVRASAKADASALVVLGHQPPAIHVLEASARRMAAPDLVALIDDFDKRWNPEVVLFETNAAFLGIKDLLVRQTRFGPRIKGVTQSKDKDSRIAVFSIGVENGSVRLKGNEQGSVDEGQRQLMDEMIAFPFGEHDDLVDATATGAAHLLDRREPRVWLL